MFDHYFCTSERRALRKKNTSHNDVTIDLGERLKFQPASGDHANGKDKYHDNKPREEVSPTYSKVHGPSQDPLLQPGDYIIESPAKPRRLLQINVM